LGAVAQEDAPAIVLADPDENAAPEPDTAAVKGESVEFTWQAMPGAARYRVQVGRSLLFSPALVDVQVEAPRLLQDLAALPRSHCYWRVSVLRSDGTEGPFSSARVLSLRPEASARSNVTRADADDGTPAPVMLPAQGDKVTFGGAARSARVAFRWAGIQRKARVEIAEDQEFKRVVKRTVFRKKDTKVELGPGEYCWRMSHPVGLPHWSGPQCFSVVMDTEPPALTIAAPGPQLFTPHVTVTIQGATEPGTRMTINRARIRLQERGEFKMLMPLSRGRNTFKLTARDPHGNQSERQVVVILVPPNVYGRVFGRMRRLKQSIQEVEGLHAEVDAQNQHLQKLMMKGTAASEELATELLAVEHDTRELTVVRKQLEDEVTAAARSLESAATEVARVK